MHNPADSTFIEAPSKAQALDWSLVLVSQGIECSILQRPEDQAWVLEISVPDQPLAQNSIAAYERENASVWRQEVRGTGLLFDARALLWFVFLIFFHAFVEQARHDFKGAGLMDRALVRHGEWWRLLTAVTLHADLGHLATNVAIGVVFLGLAMGCFGVGPALLLSLLGGVLGNVASLVLHDGVFRSLGASGQVMAALGLLTAYSVVTGRHERSLVLAGRGLMAGCLLMVLLGLEPKSDVVAHVGGFCGGLALGLGYAPWRGRWSSGRGSLILSGLAMFLVAGCWLLARH